MNIINNALNEKGFTPVSNKSLRDRRLSAAARGILAYLLSHNGHKFKVTRTTLMAEFSLSNGKVIEHLSELRKFGYIDTSKAIHNDNGTWAGKEWTIYGVSIFPNVEGAPKKRKGANSKSFSPKDSDRSAAQPNDGEFEQRLNRTSDFPHDIKKTNNKEVTSTNNNVEKEQNKFSSENSASLDTKHKLTSNTHEATYYQSQTLNAETIVDTNVKDHSELCIKQNSNTKSKLVSSVILDSDFKKDAVPAAIRVFQELHVKNYAPSKKLTKKDVENGEVSDWEKIINNVTPGTEEVWREAITEYKQEAVIKGWGNLYYVPGFISRYLNKIERTELTAQLNKTPQRAKGYINPETGLGYA